jgi:hypothetical protein
MPGMGVFVWLLLFAVVVIGIPLLCRMAIRRMSASGSVREWLRAYGPRLPFIEPDEPEDKPGA